MKRMRSSNRISLFDVFDELRMERSLRRMPWKNYMAELIEKDKAIQAVHTFSRAR
jgi:hypothetical protein